MSERCPHCGQLLFSNGVCYTCTRIEKEERRYGKKSYRHNRNPPSVPAKKVTPQSSSKAPRRTIPEQKRDLAPSSRTYSPIRTLGNLSVRDQRNRLLKGFHMLASDINPRWSRVSDVLREHGIPDHTLSQWTEDISRLLPALRTLVVLIYDDLRKSLPDTNPGVLIRAYRLDGNEDTKILQARMLSMDRDAFENDLDMQIQHLRAGEHQSRFQQLVIKAFQRIE